MRDAEMPASTRIFVSPMETYTALPEDPDARGQRIILILYKNLPIRYNTGNYQQWSAAEAQGEHMNEFRLWGRIIRNHRIAASETVPIEDGDVEAALLEICRRFDIQRPLQLPKHVRDMEQFGRTFYSKEHFTEAVSFQRLEVELLYPEGDHRPARGPRNPLSDA